LTEAPHLLSHLMGMPPAALKRTVYLWSGGVMNFGQLREGMLRMAAWLCQSAGVSAGDRVALCLPKSPEGALALYGTLAAGAAYVPLQFLGPPERLNAILKSVRPRVLLTTPAMARQLHVADATAVHTIELHQDGSGLEPLLQGTSARGDVAAIAPGDLAWLVFTSGSTGEPKGVMLSHRNMASNVEAMQHRDRMSEQDLRISHAPMHYGSAFDLLFPLVSGVRIFLLPEREAMFAERVAEVMERQRSTIWSSSATALRLLLERGGLDRRDLAAMRRISFYGEPMPLPALRKLMAALPNAEFINHYSATEVDNIATFTVPRPLPEDMLRLPLGLPAPGCQLTLRDERGREVGPGEIGEVCVVDAGVTMGYWGDPALTESKRLPGLAGSFRTGDFAFADERGLLHSAGRRDQLVKIRGHRVDLGEVEAVLRSHPNVREAFAAAPGSPEGEIRAVVLGPDEADLPAELKRLCRRHLPRHARPSRIIALQHFPQLATGKIDRQALRRLAEA
jgi:amino acid adenylation domain-containing protein